MAPWMRAHTDGASASRSRTDVQMNNFLETSSAGEWQPICPASREWDSVRREISRLRGLRPIPRPERLAGLHNPWTNTAVHADYWAFLDLCHASEVVEGVKRLIGPDVILWDSQLYLEAAEYETFIAAGREGRYWPIHPRKGAVALLGFGDPLSIAHRTISECGAPLCPVNLNEPLYVMRYFAGTSKFVRDPRFPANWIAMEEQVLLNYTTRALWVVAGEDRAGNDFVTGFNEPAPSWGLRHEEGLCRS